MLYNINRQIQEALPSPVSDDMALDEDVRPSRSVSTVLFSNSSKLVSGICHLFSNSDQRVCTIGVAHVIICFFSLAWQFDLYQCIQNVYIASSLLYLLI